MTEAVKFSSKEIRSWLEKETSSIFVPVHAKAEKLLSEMRKALESLSDTSKMLLDNSAKEIEKRNMKTYGRARALNKLTRMFIDRLRQVKVPEKVAYDSFHEFFQETQKTFAVTDVDIRNWFPKISPFFILDRRKFQMVFEKSKELLKVLGDFLTREYVKTKTLEETFQLIDKLHTLENQLVNLNEQRLKIESEKALVEKEIVETQQKMADLKNKGDLSQLNQIGMEIEKLRREVKHNLRHLRKPFIKFQRLVFNKGGLTPEELNILNHYVKNPFDAFSKEEAGYPILKEILQKLERAMSEEKLKLKSDKKRKAEQAVDDILNKNSVDGLHQKCIDVVMRKNQLSTSTEVTEAKSDLSKLQENFENLERKSKGIESEENMIEQAYNETVEKIHNHRNQIEKNIFEFMGRRVHIE